MKKIFLMLGLFYCFFIYSQTFDKCVIKDINSNSTIESCFNQITKEKEIYLYGTFSDSNSYKISCEIFKYFVKNRGCRILLIERPDAQVYNIRQYLTTSNSQYLDVYINNFDYCKKCKKIEKSFIQAIFQLYKSLPDNENFTVIGVDYDKTKFGIFALINLVNKYGDLNFPIEIYNCFNSLTNRESLQYNSQKFLSYLENNDEFFNNHFKSDYFQIKYILKNLSYYSKYGKYYSDTHDDIEKIKYQNTIDIYGYYKNPKIFGIVSIDHIAKTFMDEWIETNKNVFSFAAMLNKNDASILKDKVCTILPIYSYLVSYYHSERTSLIGSLINDKSYNDFQLYDVKKQKILYDQESDAFDYILSFPKGMKLY